MTMPSLKWFHLESEVRGLLVLTVRSKGCLPHATALALNVLAQPSVVQRYKLRGNRWTEPAGVPGEAVAGGIGGVEEEDAPLLSDETLRVLQAAKEEFSDVSAQRSTSEWLEALGAAMDEPLSERPWYHSSTRAGRTHRRPAPRPLPPPPAADARASPALTRLCAAPPLARARSAQAARGSRSWAWWCCCSSTCSCWARCSGGSRCSTTGRATARPACSRSSRSSHSARPRASAARRSRSTSSSR